MDLTEFDRLLFSPEPEYPSDFSFDNLLATDPIGDCQGPSLCADRTENRNCDVLSNTCWLSNDFVPFPRPSTSLGMNSPLTGLPNCNSKEFVPKEVPKEDISMTPGDTTADCQLWSNNRLNLDLWSRNSNKILRKTSWSKTPSSPYLKIYRKTLVLVDFKTHRIPTSGIRIAIWDPDKNDVPFDITKELFSHRYILSFHAPMTGYYTVEMRHRFLNYHFRGSPFTIPVIRKYKMHSSGTKLYRFYYQFNQTKAGGIAYSTLVKRIYVTDQNSHQVIVYRENGIVEKCFGRMGCNPKELNEPTGIAIDNYNYHIVVSDKKNHRICIYNLNGDFLFNFGKRGSNCGEFKYPNGVSVSPKDGTIAVADSGNHGIQLFDCHGNFLKKYSVKESRPDDYQSEFACPQGVSFDKSGENIYVSDIRVKALFKFDIGLKARKNMIPTGVSFYRPQGIAVDSVDNILLCDSRNNCILVLNSNGEHISSIVGNTFNSFYHPQDLVVVPSGKIIIIDFYSRIWVV